MALLVETTQLITHIAGKLLGVGICDVTPKSVSSVYFYFDPRESWRSVGTYSAIYEIQWAKQMGLAYWYAGYFVDGCQAMEYKARFRPLQVLNTDGVWRDAEHPSSIRNYKQAECV